MGVAATPPWSIVSRWGSDASDRRVTVMVNAFHQTYGALFELNNPRDMVDNLKHIFEEKIGALLDPQLM
jgi:hypothetical protein